MTPERKKFISEMSEDEKLSREIIKTHSTMIKVSKEGLTKNRGKYSEDGAVVSFLKNYIRRDKVLIQSILRHIPMYGVYRGGLVRCPRCKVAISGNTKLYVKGKLVSNQCTKCGQLIRK